MTTRRRWHAIRPGAEGLEPRTLLAAGSAPVLIGALGDSLTDEYSFYGPQAVTSLPIALPSGIDTVGRDSARNWPLILAALRPSQASFGAYTTASQGETRNQGFAQNWALSGATAAGTNLDGSGTTFAEQYLGQGGATVQPGLLSQSTATTGTNPSDLDVATILIGGNDYLHGLITEVESGGATNVFAAPGGTGLTPVNAAVENAIQAAVTQIQAVTPGTKIVLITTPDITETPLARSALATLATAYPKLGAQVAASDASLTADLTAFAASKGLGLVDFNQLYQRVAADPTIGGVTVDLGATGAALSDGFVGDGIHPGTILQGVLAQSIVGAIDATYGSAVITPISDAEIAAYAEATTPTVLLGATTVSGSTTATLQASVVAGPGPGPGALVAPTGTVTFEYYTAATATAPAEFGAVLGTVASDADGVATLAVPTAALAAGAIVAVNSGDQVTTVQMSPPLVATEVITLPGSPASPVASGSSVTLTPAYAQAHGRATVTLQVVVAADPAHLDDLTGGTVTIRSGGKQLARLPVVGNLAQVTYPLARLRGRTVRATFSGTEFFAPGQSPTVRISAHPFAKAQTRTTARAESTAPAPAHPRRR